MREVRISLPAYRVELVLDRLLPLIPSGVLEVPGGSRTELVLRGEELPSAPDLARLAGWSTRVSEREVSADWRERRAADYVPDLIGGRLVVRPVWAPAALLPRDGIEITLGEGQAFGSGGHPTTRTVLEFVLGCGPAGSFADLGCGTGVIAIAAAKLGFSPVYAVDANPYSVEMARENAQLNAVAVDAGLIDLTAEPFPPAATIAANVPVGVHVELADRLPDPPPQKTILSGFAPAEAADVLAAYERRGLRLIDRKDLHGWTVARLEPR